MSSALRISGTMDQANAPDEELQAAFEIGRANSLSPSKETFCESHWSGDESERDGLDKYHEDEPGSPDVVRKGTALTSGQEAPNSPSYPRVNGFSGQTQAQSLDPECTAEVTSSRKASNGEAGGRCRGGRGVTVERNAAVMPRGLSSGMRGCSVLPDEGKLADRVDGREEPEMPRKQTPPPSSATPSLRRSSRIAAANARVAATSAVGGDSTTAGGGNSASRVRNITAGLRSAKKGAKGSEGLDPTLTPFGTRRALRAANQDSTRARHATPVSTSKAEAFDETNTSFRTAIMGDLTPGEGGNLDVDGDTRRGALFGDDDPTNDGKLMIRSEAPITATADIEFGLFEGKEDVEDDMFSESHHMSLDGNSESAHDVEMLGDQLSRLTCGVLAEESKSDIDGRPEVASLCEDSRPAEENGTTHELFSGSLNMSAHDVSFNGGVKYPPLSPAEEGSLSPSAAAVSLPLSVLLSASESCQEDSEHAAEKGVVPTTSTLGASSFDGSDEGPKDFSELSPSGAEAGVATTEFARFEQPPGVIAAKPEAAAAAPLKDFLEAEYSDADKYVTAMVVNNTASRSLANVELEGRKLAVALISEEESRKHLLPKVVSTLDANGVPEILNAKEAGADDGDAETPDVEVYSPPEGDGPSRNAKTANKVGKPRETTPPEVAGERPRPIGSHVRSGSRGRPSAGPEVAPKRANPSRSPARRDSSAGASAANTATMPGMISTVAARRTSRVAPGRMTGNGPVIARRQSMAFVPPVYSTNSSGSGGLAGASQQASASSRGRERLLRRSNSSGVNGTPGVNGAVSRPFGSGREVVKASGTATQPPAAAPVVTPVPAKSHLLAPTAASQSRARARSVSPSVSSVRGRASVNGTLLVLPEEQPGSGAIASRRTPSASGTSAQTQTQTKDSLQKPRASSTGRRALTTPETPLFRTSQRSKVTKPTESTEDLEVRKQREMQDQLKEMTRRNQLTMERSRRATHGVNIRSSKTLTVPESPAMQTSGRLGGKVYSAAGAQAGSGSRQDSMTFREVMSRIENKTPDRFRTRPAKEQHQSKTTSTATLTDTKPTLPTAPKLRTEVRAAGHARIMSREEREEAELEEMRKHQFKARPYRSGGYGVGGENGVFKTRQSDKPPTQPEPFNLRTEDRAARRPPSPIRNRDDEEVLKQFKARPMPGTRSSSVGRVRPGANVTTRPGRLPQQQQQPLTVAESPNLMTKRRSAIRASVAGGAQVEAQAQAQEKVRPQSAAAVPDRHAGPTEPRPFNLRSEERGRAKQALLAQRLEAQRKQEEAATRVRARPMPSQSTVFVPAPSNRPLTETSEFNLPGQARHERATIEFRERVRLEEVQARRAAEVKALPIPLATYEPETVRPKSDVSPTQPLDVRLHTTTRAEGRAQWDQQNEARLVAEKRERVEQAEAAAEAEKYAIAEMRRKSQAEGGMTFKAAPITWNRSPVKCAQLSSAPLTTPITPNLQTKRRAMQVGVHEKVPPAV